MSTFSPSGPHVALEFTRLTRDSNCSYESLPPNFSLLQNMAAGAFAGIAVCHPRSNPALGPVLGLTEALGTHGYVPYRCNQGELGTAPNIPFLNAANHPPLQTRMQIINPTPSAVYNGVLHGTYRIATGEGILSLWRGMSSVIVGAGTTPSCRGCPRLSLYN
jgi:hypothetical protein